MWPEPERAPAVGIGSGCASGMSRIPRNGEKNGHSPAQQPPATAIHRVVRTPRRVASPLPARLPSGGVPQVIRRAAALTRPGISGGQTACR